MNAYEKDSRGAVTGSLNREKNNALTVSIPSNLPALRTKLIGREAELKTVSEFFNQPDIRLVTLVGFGGAGKTTLALHTAHALFGKFPGGLFFIDLTSIHEPALILPTIAATLGLQEDPSREIADTLRDFLANRSILFVLDNFEQLVSGANIIANFLDDNPHVSLLITSRETLRLRGEHVLPLVPLESADAMQVFTQYAQTLNPHFRLTEDNTPAITELCKKLDGLPLAIELAAMRTRMFTPQALLARLTSDLETDSPLLATLTSGPRDMPERQRTLRNMVAWSYNLLTDKEKHMLQAAALFRSGFGIGSLAQVTAVPENEAEHILASLVDKNLAQPFHGNEVRFHLLESIREFALEQAFKQEDVNTLTEKFIGYYLALARDAEQGFRSPEQVQWLDLLDDELANIQTALRFALDDGYAGPFFQSGYEMLIHLQRYWLLRAHYAVGVSWLEKAKAIIDRQAAISSGGISNDLLYQKSKIYGFLGYAYWIMGRYAIARDFHEVSLAAARTLNREDLLWESLNNSAINLEYMGEFEAAMTYYAQALEIIKRMGDRWQEMRLLINLGNSYVGIEEYETGRTYLEDALLLTMELKDEYYQAACLQGLGYLELRLRRHKEAEENFLKSLSLFEHMDVPFIYTWALVSLARVLGETSKHKETAQVVLKCVKMLETQKDRNLYRTMFEALIAFCISLNRNDMAARFIGFIEQNYAGEGEVILPAEKANFESMTQRVMNAILLEDFNIQMEIGRKSNETQLLQHAVEMCNEILDDMQPRTGLQTLFTERELAVLRLLAQGKTNEEISTELVVVMKTVEKHVANIFRKLGVKNRTEAAAWYLENTSPRQND